MSKARREELESSAIRNSYLERLAKARIILPTDNFFVADDSDSYYGVPWISKTSSAACPYRSPAMTATERW